MKKLFFAIVCLTMVVCLCACSGEDKAPAVTSEPTAAATQEPTAEPTYVGMNQVYGVYIPEPPFANWEGTIQDNINCYEMVTFNAYYDPNSDGKYANTQEMFKAYAMSFADYGFTVSEVGENEYRAEGEGVKSIYMYCDNGGYAKISIYR